MMAVGVQRIDVAPVVQDRRNGRGMDAFDVVDLGIGLHRNFPIAVEREADGGPLSRHRSNRNSAHSSAIGP